MTPFLLDTNVIVDALRKRNDRPLLVDQLLDQGQPLASCPITLTEIYAGMRPNEEKPTRAFMKSLRFLAITEVIAEQAGRLKANYAKRGRTSRTRTRVSPQSASPMPPRHGKHPGFPMSEIQLYPLTAGKIVSR